jgi:hypothetical protein
MSTTNPRNTRSIRFWQISFLCGSTACIILSALVLGSARLSATVSVLAIIIVVLNSLMSGDNQPSGRTNWLVSQFRRLLNVGSFLITATIMIWFCAIGLVIYAHYQINQKNIQGIIVDTSGTPLESATVVLYLPDETLTSTTNKGRFSFENVDFRNLHSPELKLEITWQNMKKTVMVNLNKMQPDRISITVQTIPPIRLSYYVLGGHALDLLLRGQIKPQWNSDLSKAHLVSSNNTFQELKNLTRRFSVPLNRELLFPLPKKRLTREQLNKYIEEHADRTLGKSDDGFSVGTGGYLLDAGISFGLSDGDVEYVNNIFTGRQSWNLVIKNDQLTTLLFWRFATRTDIERYLPQSERDEVNKRNDFLSYLISAGLPDDFVILTIDASFSGDDSLACGEFENGVVTGQLLTRKMTLRTTLIENISDQPIPLRDFGVKKNDAYRLRSRDEDNEFIGRQQEFSEPLYPQEILLPNEKIIIPLEIAFTFRNGINERDFRSSSVDKIPSYAFSEGSVILKIGSKHFNVTKEDLSRLQTSRSPRMEKDYIWGPSMELTRIQVGDTVFPVRKYDPKRLMIVSDDEDYGSCPFAFTYSRESNAWILESHILYGRNKKTKEGFDVIALSRFDGRVLIREKDPEDAFIDQVYVVERLSDGSERKLFPDKFLLAHADNRHLVLRQHDEVLIEFSGYTSAVGATYSLVSKGYYLPYKNRGNWGINVKSNSVGHQ